MRALLRTVLSPTWKISSTLIPSSNGEATFNKPPVIESMCSLPRVCRPFSRHTKDNTVPASFTRGARLATCDVAALTIRYAQLFHLGINRGRLRKTRALFVSYETGHVQAKLAMRHAIPEVRRKAAKFRSFNPGRSSHK